jgi:Tol biopolymer transport system component
MLKMKLNILKQFDAMMAIWLRILPTSLIVLILIAGCSSNAGERDGITFVAPRENRPPAQSIVWSPIDSSKLLISANEAGRYPSEVYILDIKTMKKEVLVGPQSNAWLIHAKWMSDGRKVLILAVDTLGYEPSGWWAIDADTRLAEYVIGPVDDAAWSPDGKVIAVLHKDREHNTGYIELKLIDVVTKTEQIINTYEDMDYIGGLSWSPDGKHVVFSLGKYQMLSNLFVLDIEDQQVIDITENDIGNYPSWSPKGNIIVLEVDGHLHLIGLDEKCEVEIPNLQNVWSPTWLPDGKKLLF